MIRMNRTTTRLLKTMLCCKIIAKAAVQKPSADNMDPSELLPLLARVDSRKAKQIRKAKAKE